MPRQIDNLVGQKFNDLTVESFLGTIPKDGAVWTCRCKCGELRAVLGRHLKQSSVKRCMSCVAILHGAQNRISRLPRLERIARKYSHHPPELRVLKAIELGAKTQPEIARQAKLPFEELGLVLVNLIIEQKRVASRINGDSREYFLTMEVAA